MSCQKRIENILQAQFTPSQLEVENMSHRHTHHKTNDSANKSESHYKVTIESTALNGLSRVAAHRKVMAALQPEFDAGLHSVELKVINAR